MKQRVVPIFVHLSAIEFLTDIIQVDSVEKHGFNALHLAANNGRLKVVELLVNSVPTNSVSKSGWNALHCAAVTGHLAVVEFLANIIPTDAVTNSGWNALHIASMNGHFSLVEFLSHLIPIEIKDKRGYTAFDHAKQSKNKSIADYLKNLGRLPNETRQEGVNRRLKDSHGKSYENAILRIKHELETELPMNFKNWVITISGSGWPNDIQACPDFNKGKCDTKNSIHSDDKVHVCVICKSLFGTGFFHSAKSCDMLKSLDSGLDINFKTAIKTSK